MSRKRTYLIRAIASLTLCLGIMAGAACRPDRATDPDLRTTPEFRRMTEGEIVIVSGDGSNSTLKVRIADDADERMAGFQNIGTRVVQRSLILFVFAGDIAMSFHMRNVSTPLDIAFIDSNGTVISTTRMELGQGLYGPGRIFRYALEGPAGSFKDKGITTGTRIQIR